MRCKGGGRRGARRGLANHDRQCAVATACTNLVGLVLTCAAGAAAVGALAAAPFRGRAPAGAASAPDAIVPALAADAALPVRADDVSTPSADDEGRPRKYKRRCASLQDELRAGGDAAGRRRRGASDGHTASTASCGHCGHAGRASSAFFGVRGVLFLCKECRPAHESTVLRRHSRTD